MPRHRYSAEARTEAVRLVLESQTPVSHVARDVGCSTDTMHRWLREHRQHNSKPKQNSKPNRQHDSPPVIVNKTRPVAPQSQATFIPVNIIDHKTTSIEIVTPDGYTLRLTDTNSQYIAELLGILGSC